MDRSTSQACATTTVQRCGVCVFSCRQALLSSVLDVLTPEDVRVLAQTEDELCRKGDFQRIFPSPTSSHYLRFVEHSRYLNILLDQWGQKYSQNGSKGVCVCFVCVFHAFVGVSPLTVWQPLGEGSSTVIAGLCLHLGIHLLKTLCQKGVHLGTSDPAHIVSTLVSVFFSIYHMVDMH